MSRFDGRIAIVTGAASGIGRAIALRLASEGAALACLDVAEEGALETASTARASKGRPATAVVCDISDADAVAAAFLQVEAELGMPDVLCNAAGIGTGGHFEESSVEEFDRIISVNLRGTYLVCREFLARQGTTKAMAERQPTAPKPSIVNVASTAGVMGHPYCAIYSASKGGVVTLTRTLAVEFVERGVRINAVAPGGVDTPLIGSFVVPEDASMQLLGRIIPPMGFAKPEEIAAVVAFLASDEASIMSGAIVVADGTATA
jgi:NAD(P)-dependent dehydrogenase (short-subunit alcohol dehydrogenase family)